MSDTNTPTLTLVRDETTPEEPPQARSTIADAVRGYAGLVTDLRGHKISEGGAIRLIELGLNAHFTMLQMGLARPTAPFTEVPNGNESTSTDTFDNEGE